MRILWKVIRGLFRVVWRAFRTFWITIMVLLLLMSAAMNVAVFSSGAIATAIATAIEAVTGAETVLSRLKGKTAEAAKLEGKAAGSALQLEREKVARVSAEADLARTKKLASEFEGTAIGRGLALEREKATRAAVEIEAAGLRKANRVVYEDVEMTVQEAVMLASRKIKARTFKLATADLSATAAQSLPWVGAAAVVAATGFDLKMSCDTMRDMHAIELSVNPELVDDPNMDYVCGLRVPSEVEIWAAIKASPGAVWDAAKDALDSLPAMPELLEFGWPTLPEIGMQSLPDVNWTFWK